jgi:hypothetical protein
MTNFTDEGIQSVGDEINEPDVSNEGARTRGMGVEAGLTETDASDESKGDSARQPTQAEILIELSREMVLFRSSDGEDYASFQNGGHKETLPLKSKDFKDYLAARFYELKGKAPHSNALQSALAVLRGRASMIPWQQPVYSRLAQMGSKVYLNLADDRWRVVEATSSGWEVVSDHPIFFLRPKGMAALPIPERGWCVSELRRFINFADDEDFILLVSWLVAALRPVGPYPILVLQGEQGSAKSTTAKMLRSLVDPSIAPLRRLPRNERDLMIAAKNSWVLAFDNISKIPEWLADAFSSLATGGGLSTRQLYSDTDETHLDATRPIMLNGIEDLATRGDLLDRAIVINLPKISSGERKREESLWQDFEVARPRILGALLLAVAHGLYNVDRIHRRKYPRMADFAHWSAATASGQPWEDWQFINAYEANILGANAICLEADVVAGVVQALMEDTPSWEGSAAELLEKLNEIASEEATSDKDWPTAANWLTNRLRRIAPALRRSGIDVEFDDKARPKRIIISNTSRN